MLSARLWSANRSFGRALVFWLWLGGFVFSFAAGECFHCANCPDHALLKWAAHAGSTSASASHSASAPGADVECLACALASLTLVFVAASVQAVLWLGFTLLDSQARPVRSLCLPALSLARGPPVTA